MTSKFQRRFWPQDQIPDKYNHREPDTEQCDIVEFDLDDGYTCCTRKRGHEGVHISYFGSEFNPKHTGRPPVEAEDADDLRERIKVLEAAIRLHRDQKGDDRCWLDDIELYKVLPEGAQGLNTALPPKDQFLANCARYQACRQRPGDTYVTVDQMVSTAEWKLSVAEQSLRTANKKLKIAVEAIEAECRKFNFPEEDRPELHQALADVDDVR